MPSLLFFCGHAGAGKTTLAKRVLQHSIQTASSPYCFLDKDTLYGDYSATVMGVLTGDPHDRDSPLYLQHLRNPEYHGLLETARENLSLGINTIIVGPLSQEIKKHQLSDPAWLKVPVGTHIKIVWVYLNEKEARERIERRADRRDSYKLAHWEDYRTRLFMPEAAAYPELIFYDNSHPTEMQFSALITALNT